MPKTAMAAKLYYSSIKCRSLLPDSPQPPKSEIESDSPIGNASQNSYSSTPIGRFGYWFIFTGSTILALYQAEKFIFELPIHKELVRFLGGCSLLSPSFLPHLYESVIIELELFVDAHLRVHQAGPILLKATMVMGMVAILELLVSFKLFFHSLLIRILKITHFLAITQLR